MFFWTVFGRFLDILELCEGDCAILGRITTASSRIIVNCMIGSFIWVVKHPFTRSGSRDIIFFPSQQFQLLVGRFAKMPMSNKKMGKLHQFTSTGTALGLCQRCPPSRDHVQNSWGFAKMLARNAALLAKTAKMAIRHRTQCRISPDFWANKSGF